MCEHAPNREEAMTVIRRNDEGVPTVWCDPCIAPLVTALNDAGMATVASCCGHGKYPTRISLSDGREVIVYASEDVAPTPAPVAVPDVDALVGGLDRIHGYVGLSHYRSARLTAEECNDARVTVEAVQKLLRDLHARREDAPRPEPVVYADHHVPGAENFNALLDDVLANPQACEAFEKAQAEPTVAPLPTEAVEALAQVIIDARDAHSYPVDGDDGWEERCRCGLWPPISAVGSQVDEALWLWRHQHTEVARAVLAAGYTLPAADQRARDEDDEPLGPDPELVRKWTGASEAARKAEHHFPADCLAEAVLVYTSLTERPARDEGTVREAVVAAIENDGSDPERPEHPAYVAGWRACAEAVLKALEGVRDADSSSEAESLRRQLAAVRELAELDRQDVFLAPGSKIKRVQEDRRRDLGAIVTTSMVSVEDLRTALDGSR